ncbi:MAG TPA: quinohemoprotein amine dehydrogenase subunit alpha [Steroidobacteraceae bacterium]|nr:quinohemoprotein amine dehydrogenase subunit alpha [Steroidobacteraceae bacterium]
MSWKVSSAISRCVIAAVLACSAPGFAHAAPAGQSPVGLVALRTHCGECHREVSPGSFDRISQERKTPEGWAMTIFRMRQVHGVQLTSEAEGAIIQYLSDAQGLAPSEVHAGRYALERRPNVPDLKLPGDLNAMCGRCHSLARVALQRRTAAEWEKLADFHVGEWPYLEYEDGSRDLDWFGIATTQLPAKLAHLFPLQTPAWQEWKDRPHASLAGQWIVHGEMPGRGAYYGVAHITRTAPDRYRTRYQLQYADGAPFNGSSDAILYTGFEWRGTGTLGAKSLHEVYFASADGTQIDGRWFLSDHSEIGGDWAANRSTGTASVLAVIPSALKAGTTQRVIVIGRALRGTVDLGTGTRSRVVARKPYGLILAVSVEPQAAPGYRTVHIGGASRSELLAVYRHVDRLEVEPVLAIARVGGGALAPVEAQFRAIGYMDLTGANGKVTPVRLGAMPVTWSVAPFDAAAAKRGDVRFAGTLDQDGLFRPAGGGPDPEREFSDNNTGDLFVTATPKAGQGTVAGKAHLVVTIQRWVTPAIY